MLVYTRRSISQQLVALGLHGFITPDLTCPYGLDDQVHKIESQQVPEAIPVTCEAPKHSFNAQFHHVSSCFIQILTSAMESFPDAPCMEYESQHVPEQNHSVL